MIAGRALGDERRMNIFHGKMEGKGYSFFKIFHSRIIGLGNIFALTKGDDPFQFAVFIKYGSCIGVDTFMGIIVGVQEGLGYFLCFNTFNNDTVAENASVAELI